MRPIPLSPHARKGEDTDVPRANLSLASRLEHSIQTINSRRWPSVPCFPCRTDQLLLEVGVGSVSPVPSRIAHPWRRVSQVRLRGCCAAATRPHASRALETLRKDYDPVYRKTDWSAEPGRGRLVHTATGSGFTRNLLTIATAGHPVKRFGRQNVRICQNQNASLGSCFSTPG